MVKLENDVKVWVCVWYGVGGLYLFFGGVGDEGIWVEGGICGVSWGICLEGGLSNEGEFGWIGCEKVKGVWKGGGIYVLG